MNMSSRLPLSNRTYGTQARPQCHGRCQSLVSYERATTWRENVRGRRSRRGGTGRLTNWPVRGHDTEAQVVLHAKTDERGWAARFRNQPVFWPLSQFLTGHMRTLRAFVVITVLVSAATACRARDRATPVGGTAPVRGGELVVSVRTDPQSFNWFTKRDGTTHLVTYLTQARAVRVNRVTQETEPWLAEGWTRSEDGRRYTLTLRPGIAFADGQPFTAADV